MGFLERIKNRQNNKFTIGVLLVSAASLISYTQPLISGILSYKIFGIIDVGMLAGIGALYGAFVVYNGRI